MNELRCMGLILLMVLAFFAVTIVLAALNSRSSP